MTLIKGEPNYVGKDLFLWNSGIGSIPRNHRGGLYAMVGGKSHSRNDDEVLCFQLLIKVPWVKHIEHTEGFYSISQVSKMTGIPIGTLSKNVHYPKPAKRVGKINMRLYTIEQVEQIKIMNKEYSEYLTMQQAAMNIGCSPSSIRKFEGTIFFHQSRSWAIIKLLVISVKIRSKI